METPHPSPVTFEAPGPGHWELDTLHAQRPMSRYSSSIFPSGMRRGFGEAAAYYGLLIDHLRIVPIHGFGYSQMVPFGFTPQGPLPPTHPDIAQRMQTAQRALEGKLWREDLRRWEEEDKPACLRANLAFEDVDPTALSDEELTRHLRDVGAHTQEMIRLHHRYTPAHIIPVGDFLAHATAWTGKSAGELGRLLKGASVVSAQLGTREPPALVRALREDPAARALLLSGKPAQDILDGLKAMPGTVGEQMKAHLREVGNRSLGYDIAEPAVKEVPEALVGGIRSAVVGRSPEDASAEAAHLTRMREAVPAEHQAQFDELLAEARRLYGLRDDRGVHTDGWAIGLARRAVLAVGERLRHKGRLTDAALALEADEAELVGLMTGAQTPTSEELRRRAEWRLKEHTGVPTSLGPPAPPPPPLDRMPPAVRRMNGAMMFYLHNMFGEPPAQTTKTSVKGVAVSPGIYEGTARVITEQTDLGRIQAGDVLVATTTSPYFNVVLPLLGAIVTDRGGMLCHAAIVTREYGIPGIVGTRDATKLVRDGARVRVDGTTGVLEVLS